MSQHTNSSSAKAPKSTSPKPLKASNATSSTESTIEIRFLTILGILIAMIYGDHRSEIINELFTAVIVSACFWFWLAEKIHPHRSIRAAISLTLGVTTGETMWIFLHVHTI